MRDIFYLNVSLLQERNDILEIFDTEPPEWLTRIGDAQSQALHLHEKVVIEIYEKFEFVPDERFIGYKWVSNQS